MKSFLPCVELGPRTALVFLRIHTTKWSGQAKRDLVTYRVSGQRPEQGAASTLFCEAKNVGTRPLPCTVGFCILPG